MNNCNIVMLGIATVMTTLNIYYYIKHKYITELSITNSMHKIQAPINLEYDR